MQLSLHASLHFQICVIRSSESAEDSDFSLHVILQLVYIEQWFLAREARPPKGENMNFHGARALTRSATF